MIDRQGLGAFGDVEVITRIFDQVKREIQQQFGIILYFLDAVDQLYYITLL